MSANTANKILIVGLGNPGKQYEETRHNVGFLFLDMLKKHFLDFGLVPRIKTVKDEYTSFHFELDPTSITLLYPLTFMNKSGLAIAEYLKYNKVSSIYVVHDDLDLVLGDFKIQLGIGPKQHNGIISVEQLLGSKDFYRIRIGVNNRHNQPFNGSGADYVLERFAKKDLQVIKDTFIDVQDKFFGIIS